MHKLSGTRDVATQNATKVLEKKEENNVGDFAIDGHQRPQLHTTAQTAELTWRRNNSNRS